MSVVYVFHGKLIDHTENIVFRRFKINQRYHDGQTVLRCELNAVYHPFIHLVQGGKVALGTGKTNGVVKLLSFLRQQTGTGLCDKGFEILGNQDFAVTARNLIPGEVVPAD